MWCWVENRTTMVNSVRFVGWQWHRVNRTGTRIRGNTYPFIIETSCCPAWDQHTLPGAYMVWRVFSALSVLTLFFFPKATAEISRVLIRVPHVHGSEALLDDHNKFMKLPLEILIQLLLIPQETWAWKSRYVWEYEPINLSTTMMLFTMRLW